MTASTIRVAIIGGGLGGAVLMNALTKYPQLDVHLYEANTEFQERGASIGITPNARRAFDLLGLGDIVQKAGAGEGPDAQENIVDMEEDLDTVHRAALLKQLIEPLSKENIHFGKRLESISGNTLKFLDGFDTTADLIIGSDGIHSSVRKFILGEGHPACDPVFAGFWDCRTILPAKEARAKIGSYRFNEETPRQHMYIGNNSMFLHDIIDDGDTVCIVGGGSAPADWDKTRWKQSVSRQWLAEVFHNWGKFGTQMLELLCGDQTEMSTFVQWASAEAPTLFNGHICMIGDAAHATTPWMGSGLALSIEDSLIIQSVLGRCTNTKDIPAALKAYDQVMRPRGQRIIEASQGTGLICTGKNGLSRTQLAQELPPRWEFIIRWDTEGAVASAVRIFEESKSS